MVACFDQLIRALSFFLSRLVFVASAWSQVVVSTLCCVCHIVRYSARSIGVVAAGLANPALAGTGQQAGRQLSLLLSQDKFELARHLFTSVCLPVCPLARQASLRQNH